MRIARRRKMKKGFTLIELLVVVLIIGILSAVALPQYTTAVEKARITEALQNIATMEKQIDLYLLENASIPEILCYKDFASVELAGGEWFSDYTPCRYQTKNFNYFHLGIYNSRGHIEASSRGMGPTLISENKNNGHTYVKVGNWYHACFTLETDMGRKICKQLQSQGWGYNDRDI